MEEIEIKEEEKERQTSCKVKRETECNGVSVGIKRYGDMTGKALQKSMEH